MQLKESACYSQNSLPSVTGFFKKSFPKHDSILMIYSSFPELSKKQGSK